MTSPFIVRLAQPDDLRFVCASWFESFWKGAIQATGVPFDVYKRGQDALIRRLLARSLTTILASAAVPDEIVGYAVVEPDVAHYCYVKSAFRRFGAAKGLLRGTCTRYSHQTNAGERVARSLGLTYDPYTLTAE